MHFYSAYGLAVQSEFPIPAFETLDADTSPDVVIRFGPFERPSQAPPPGSVCLQATNETFILVWDQIGFVRIRLGREILIDPSDDLDQERLLLSIIGPIFAVLLHQRDYLILHGSAVSIADQAVVFLGHSGEGKSTMAAAMQARGYNLVADDIVAVSLQNPDTPMVFAGFPQLKLWPEVADTLQGDAKALPKLHPEMAKRALRTPQNFQAGALPLKCIYVLVESDQFEPRIVTIEPQEALIELVRYSFLVRVLKRSGSMARHFQQSSALVNQVQVRRLLRRKTLSELSDLAGLVEVDVKAQLARA